jgi:hypothetical protein
MSVPKPNDWDYNRPINTVTDATFGEMWEELNAYREIGTIEEFKELKEATNQ